MKLIALINRIDSATRFAKFSVSHTNELTLLPTTKRRGVQDTPASSISPICAGSLAYVTDADNNVYVLNGETDQWIKVNKSSGGGGGDEEPLTPEQMQEILDLIGQSNSPYEPLTPEQMSDIMNSINGQ